MKIILLFYHSNDLLRPTKVNSNQHIKHLTPYLLMPLIKTRGHTFFYGDTLFYCKILHPLILLLFGIQNVSRKNNYFVLLFVLQLEYQRQELLKERQQFHMDQMKAAEFRARQIAAQQLNLDSKVPGHLPPIADGSGSRINPVADLQSAQNGAAKASQPPETGSQKLDSNSGSNNPVSHENSKMCF